MSIIGIVPKLLDEIKQLHAKIDAIQRACTHPKEALSSLPGASTGNYDPSNDSYWIDHKCGLCMLRWREEQ